MGRRPPPTTLSRTGPSAPHPRGRRRPSSPASRPGGKRGHAARGHRSPRPPAFRLSGGFAASRWIMPEVEITLERRLRLAQNPDGGFGRRARRCLGTGTDSNGRARASRPTCRGLAHRCAANRRGLRPPERGQFCPTTPRSSVWDCPQERRVSARSIISSGSPARTRWQIPVRPPTVGRGRRARTDGSSRPRGGCRHCAGRPEAAARIADGLEVLRDQECVGGGWTTAERGVGVAQPPFVQTTAVAVLRSPVWTRPSAGADKSSWSDGGRRKRPDSCRWRARPPRWLRSGLRSGPRQGGDDRDGRAHGGRGYGRARVGIAGRAGSRPR